MSNTKQISNDIKQIIWKIANNVGDMDDGKITVPEMEQRIYDNIKKATCKLETTASDICHGVSNSGLIGILTILQKYDFEPTMRQDWILSEKGKMEVLHRAKSKESLIDFVICHYC